MKTQGCTNTTSASDSLGIALSLDSSNDQNQDSCEICISRLLQDMSERELQGFMEGKPPGDGDHGLVFCDTLETTCVSFRSGWLHQPTFRIMLLLVGFMSFVAVKLVPCLLDKAGLT